MANGEDLIGRTLGKLKIQERLGHGKTSQIFKAFYKPLQKQVAVKILKEDARATPELRTKFLNEAKALAKLDHENIVKIFDVVEAGGYLMIIMELLRGDDLWQVLRQEGRIEPERAVEITGKVASALEAAHRQGIVHRDVKPANIMIVGRRQEVKLLDFGLATAGIDKGRAGTPHYMSPEQVQGKRVDEKTDIYSLGASFFHMLTGTPPYTGKTVKEIKEQHLKGELPSPSRTNREAKVPKSIDPVVKRMMAPIPGYRFTARDLVTALDDLNLQARGHRRQTRAVRAAARKGPGPAVILGSIAAVAVVVIVLVVLLTSGKEDEKDVGPVSSGGGARDASGHGTGPVNAIPDDRANQRLIRENLAEKAFHRAQSFESRSFGKDEEILARYQQVWDEYGETGWGQKAQAKIDALKKRIDAEARRVREIEEMTARQQERPAFDKKLSAVLKAYDFDAAETVIKEWLDKYETEDPKLTERFNRIEDARYLLELLAEEINRNNRKYPLSLFKTGAREESLIQSADATGVLIKEGGIEQRLPWSSFAAEELGRLAQRQLSLRDYKHLYYIGNFFIVLGEREQGEDWIRNAKGLDRFGWVDQKEKKVKPK